MGVESFLKLGLHFQEFYGGYIGIDLWGFGLPQTRVPLKGCYIGYVMILYGSIRFWVPHIWGTFFGSSTEDSGLLGSLR